MAAVEPAASKIIQKDVKKKIKQRSARLRGTGILGIIERAQRMGATLTINPGTAGSTEIQLSADINGEQENSFSR